MASPASASSSPTEHPDPSPGTLVERGTPAFRRITLALFLAGFSTFSLLYCVQPLMPLFSASFDLSAASSSLSLSVSTATLAVSILLASGVSEAVGRKGVIAVSLCVAAALNLAAAAMPGWQGLLITRAAEGLALGGTPAVAMAYVSEEIHPRGLGVVMGLYIGGNGLGGMFGRLVTGLVADLAGWRAAMTVVGGLSVLAALGFLLLLPPSRNFRVRSGLTASYHLAAWLAHLRHPRLPWLFAIAFLVMGAFVSVYNYTGYRLARPPFELGQGVIGAIFLVYLFGVVASTSAGALGDRFGRAQVMSCAIVVALAGTGLTLASWLPAIVAGIALVTIGFFAAHSCASSAVGRLALQHKGHAASLYLLFYYLGSSVLGSAGGLFWSRGGWGAVCLFVAVTLSATLLIAGWLARTAPLPGR